jgi:hypothetical protein
MADNTYHIRIKKEYVSAILEDLQQIDAIEIVADPIPEWQKNEVRRRLAEMQSNPSSVISEEDFFRLLEEEDDEEI